MQLLRRSGLCARFLYQKMLVPTIFRAAAEDRLRRSSPIFGAALQGPFALHFLLIFMSIPLKSVILIADKIVHSMTPLVFVAAFRFVYTRRQWNTVRAPSTQKKEKSAVYRSRAALGRSADCGREGLCEEHTRLSSIQNWRFTIRVLTMGHYSAPCWAPRIEASTGAIINIGPFSKNSVIKMDPDPRRSRL